MHGRHRYASALLPALLPSYSAEVPEGYNNIHMDKHARVAFGDITTDNSYWVLHVRTQAAVTGRVRP